MAHYVSFILVLLAIGFYHDANAATTIPYQTRPPLQEYLPVDSSGNIRTQTTYETKAVTPSGQHVTRYTTKPTPISPSSLGKMAKGALTGPLGLGITAAIIAADYFIDSNGDIVITEGQPASTITGVCTAIGGNPQRTWVQCRDAYTSGKPPPYSFTSDPITASPARIRMARAGYGTHYWEPSAANAPTYNPPSYYEPIATTYPSDDQIGDAISSYDSNNNNKVIPNLIPESIQSGRWRDEWPEAVTDSTTINDTLENDIEGATNPNTDPTVTDSSTANPVPVQNTTNNNNQMAEEWPVFCTWAFYVCDFIDWVQEEPEPPQDVLLPEQIIEAQSYSSGLPAGSCPAPLSVVNPINGSQIQMQYTPFCDLATASKPLVISISWLLAAFIVLGVRK